MRQQMANPRNIIKARPAYWVHFRNEEGCKKRHLILTGVDEATGAIIFDSPNHGVHQLKPKDIVTIKQMSLS